MPLKVKKRKSEGDRCQKEGIGRDFLKNYIGLFHAGVVSPDTSSFTQGFLNRLIMLEKRDFSFNFLVITSYRF